VIPSQSREKLPVSLCPKCNSQDVRRSQTRSRWERWRKEITGKSPYRCRRCSWRGWLTADLSELDSARRKSNAPEPPNLRGTQLARADKMPRLDVKELDQFHTLNNKDDA
jgi:hypothetical protein